MADDIVERLRLLWTEPFDAVALYETINATAAEIERLWDELRTERAEAERLRDEMSTMHRTVVHDCCVQVQSERRLADQLADALRWQADPFQTETLGMTHRALDAYEEARRG